MLTEASRLAVVVSDSSRTNRLSFARIRLVFLVNTGTDSLSFPRTNSSRLSGQYWHGLIVFPSHEFVSSFWSRFDIRLAHHDSGPHVEDARHPRNAKHSGSCFNS